MENNKETVKQNQWLKIIIHLSSSLPLLLLGLVALRGNLGFNRVKTVLQRTRRAAVITLLLSLACTPIHNVFKVPEVRRSSLGESFYFYSSSAYRPFTNHYSSSLNQINLKIIKHS
ncbi:MAG: hypothetical protein U9R53_06065 [Chloroflexota bacterium]|nr:hypothetical protein [Chloroflexota bacterium]